MAKSTDETNNYHERKVIFKVKLGDGTIGHLNLSNKLDESDFRELETKLLAAMDAGIVNIVAEAPYVQKDLGGISGALAGL